MRTPEFLSPSSLKTFEANRDEFYLKYLATARPPRLGQTRPMSVGSAFDAYVKSYIHYCLFGNYGHGDGYAKDTIFEKQVEPQNRDWAKEAGAHVFEAYKRCGALSDLMLELNTSVNKPRFEFDIKGIISASIGDIPMLGKPDVFFINSEGARVILDWKVNGYCGNSTTSPKTGYVKIRDAWTSSEAKPSRNNGFPHKDCYPVKFKGILINPAIYMEAVDSEWADQESIYAWLLGEEVGSEDLIVGIEQIVAQPGSLRPLLRVASHRCKVSGLYQYALLDRVSTAWNAIKTGHIFTDLTREESDQRCADLENQAEAVAQTDDLSQFVNQVSRHQ
jgi:hypothetical protein